MSQVIFIQLILDKEIALVFGPPAGVGVLGAAVGRCANAIGVGGIGHVPEINRVLVIVHIDGAGVLLLITVRRARIGDDQRCAVVDILAAAGRIFEQGRVGRVAQIQQAKGAAVDIRPLQNGARRATIAGHISVVGGVV